MLGGALKVYTTAPMEDARDARSTFRRLEEIGYDGAFSFEAKLDPFLPLVLASENTTRLRLGTAIAIAFARTPMNLAYAAHGLQAISGGRFVLGLGSQVQPHIEKRFGMPWSRPAARMRELVLALRAIFFFRALRTEKNVLALRAKKNARASREKQILALRA